MVFVLSFTAILGKLSSYGSLFLTWHRTTIAFIVFLCVPQFWRDVAQIPYRQIGIYAIVGVLMCLHWVAFYTSVKEGDSVSITLTCMGTMAMYASILEPIILGVPFSIKDLLISVIVICGIMQVYFSLPEKPPTEGVLVNYEAAIFWGLVAPFFIALVSVLNKANINKGTALSIATIEIGASAVFLTFIIPLVYGNETIWYPRFDVPNMSWDTLRMGPFDLVWVTLLAVFGTNMCMFLQNKALSHISAFTANLIGILEPVYGILLGALIFKENQDLSVDFYYGAGIILFALVANSVFSGIGEPHAHASALATTINSALVEEVVPLVGTSGGIQSSSNGSSKYVANLRKPKVSPAITGGGTHARRIHSAHSDDMDDEDVSGRPLFNGNMNAIPV